MRITRGLHNLRPASEATVATIGNFDGMHLGHRAVLEHVASEGRRRGLPVVVMLFEPQPLEFFQPETAPERLTRLKEKLVRLAEMPVDRVVVIRFDRAFAAIEPEHFVREVLVRRLRVAHLVVGDDFRFGHQRRGDFAMLERMGRELGYSVSHMPTFRIDGRRVSSTLIRAALKSGDLDLAERLLGRPYSILGRVVGGNRLGRELGFPTANLHLLRKNTPVEGVYAVTVAGLAEREWPGVANVGTRPTLGGSSRALLEVHLFDFDREIYGHELEVRFRFKLREERCFASLDELRAQIERDAVAARAWLEGLRQVAQSA